MPKPLARLHLCGFIFTLDLIPTLFLFILLPILLHLGFWQLDRAHYKKQLEQNFLSRQQQSPLSFAKLGNNIETLEYYPVKVSGYYDNKHTILLDNQMQNHQVGYQVFTPFLPEHAQKFILINRGWIAASRNRRQLPTIAPVAGLQTIEGLLKLPPQKVFLLSHQVDLHWPLLIEGLDFSKIKDALHQSLYPYLILLSPRAEHGFSRQWQPTVAVPAAKHTGYAIQWFALALTLVIIYLVLNIRKVK